MGRKGNCKFSVLPEPKKYVYLIDDKTEVVGTDAVEFGGTLYVYDGKEKMGIFKSWVSVLRKNPHPKG